MGVFVKGMYLPPSCYFCHMTNEGLYLCKANNPYKQLEDDCEERRPNWCPLTEVPEPHGRIGDLDDIIKRAKKWIDHPDEYISQRNKDMIYILEREDAIIPASEEE